MKVGIITFEFNYNYGAVLQATALSDYITCLGHKVQIINRGWGALPPRINALNVNNLVGKLAGFYTLSGFNAFKRKYWDFTDKIVSEADLKRVFSEFDTIVVGSDQIWNSACIKTMGLYYFGIDADLDRQKLIAYAPSFGKNRFDTTKDNVIQLTEHLKRFRAISVRESDGVSLLKKYFGIDNAIKVLDPTMLMDKDYYLRLAGVKDLKRKDTLAYYLLDNNEEKMEYINRISQDLGLRPVNLYLAKDSGIPVIGKLKSLKYPSVEYWLRSIAESQMVVTDSFHGTVFSILFNRDFVTFGNAERGNSRFENLLTMFDLKDRIADLRKGYRQKFPAIDYLQVNSKLEDLRQISQSFLKEALT